MRTSDNNNAETLQSYVDAMRSVSADSAAIERSQRHLNTRIETAARAQPLKKRVTRWAPAGALAALTLALVIPMFSIAPGVAFAQVQQHFVNFMTLAISIETHVSGAPPMRTEVTTDKSGNTRVEIADQVSIVVNADAGEILQLLHPPKLARLSALGNNGNSDDSLRWLDDLRRFRGEATMLDETRIIDSHPARGWQLQLQGMNATLWARADGTPLLLTMYHGELMHMNITFRFDNPIPDGTFSTKLPDGYALTPMEN